MLPAHNASALQTVHWKHKRGLLVMAASQEAFKPSKHLPTVKIPYHTMR